MQDKQQKAIITGKAEATVNAFNAKHITRGDAMRRQARRSNEDAALARELGLTREEVNNANGNV